MCLKNYVVAVTKSFFFLILSVNIMLILCWDGFKPHTLFPLACYYVFMAFKKFFDMKLMLNFVKYNLILSIKKI